jgi:hypothetical protein
MKILKMSGEYSHNNQLLKRKEEDPGGCSCLLHAAPPPPAIPGETAVDLEENLVGMGNTAFMLSKQSLNRVVIR